MERQQLTASRVFDPGMAALDAEADRPLAASARARALAEAATAAQRCRACALDCRSSRVVFGEGPAGAAVMLVGEQPDAAGEAALRPFAGAAGRVLDRALADAGVDRGRVYVTHAVKHARHGRRSAQRAVPGAAAACRRWLGLERALVQPRLIVALGAAAAEALLGRPVAMHIERGRVLPLADGGRLLVTEQPATILQLADRLAQGREYRRLVNDLLRAVPHLRRAA